VDVKPYIPKPMAYSMVPAAIINIGGGFSICTSSDHLKHQEPFAKAHFSSLV
jgi:hypothetical protein